LQIQVAERRLEEMKVNLICYLLGHDLEAHPAEFEEVEWQSYLGQFTTKHKSKVRDGFLSCQRSGCSFHRRLWDEDEPEEEMTHNKYDDTFWQSSFWRNTVAFVEVFVPTAVWVFAALAMIYLVVAVPSQLSCNSLHTKFGLKTVWDFWNGCMIYSQKFGWIPDQNYFQIINLNIP
jgi:hypothetical protein